jgi:hypothetical protein
MLAVPISSRRAAGIGRKWLKFQTINEGLLVVVIGNLH